jgi:hypothetical protein
MNKFIFAVALLVCLLFVDMAASIRTTDSLSASLAVRKQKLRVEVAEVGEGKNEGVGGSDESDLKERIQGAIAQLTLAESNLRSLLNEAKRKAKEAAFERVKKAIDVQIAKIQKEQADKKLAIRAARAADRVLRDPDTLKEIEVALTKRIEAEIIRSEKEKEVEQEVSKDLLQNIVKAAEKAHNDTVSAQSVAAQNVAIALKDAEEQVKASQSAAKLAAKELKVGVVEAITNAQAKYDSLMTEASTGHEQEHHTEKEPLEKNEKNNKNTHQEKNAGLIQMASLKKLKQQLKKTK